VWSPGTQSACNANGCEEILPDGITIQWGIYDCSLELQNQVLPFPYSFRNSVWTVIASYLSNIVPTSPLAIGAQPISTSAFEVTCASSSPGTYGMTWVAYGN
jgi:hypothetical protein